MRIYSKEEKNKIWKRIAELEQEAIGRYIEVVNWDYIVKMLDEDSQKELKELYKKIKRF